MEQMLEKARLEYFFNNSQNRRLRRKMAKNLGLMKQGWQGIKDEFPPYNKPMDLGIKKFKRSLRKANSGKKTCASSKDVIEYKLRARKALSNTIKEETSFTNFDESKILSKEA